jgi:DNA-binding transcriptional LysR family regulator
MDFETLTQLIMFAESGTLSLAAQKLHTSQPSLSRSMKKLEEEIGVPLFSHQKNRLAFTDTGLLAVEYARQILADRDLLISSVRAFEKKKHTISIGTCAPAPLWTLIPSCSAAFPEMTITSEMKSINTLIEGLTQSRSYQLVVLPFPLFDDQCQNFLYLKENLGLAVPPEHPLADRDSVHFSDFDGETILTFSDIGFWDDIHRKNLPNSHFISQKERNDLVELIRSSTLPCFATNLSMKRQPFYTSNRVVIAIEDKDAHASFYVTYRKEDRHLLKPLLQLLK